ncbi:Alkylated DNA repair protein alkB-like 8, partial [Cucurbita argyrosperma subsp. argyrosperma]
MKEIKVRSGSNADPDLLNDETHAQQLTSSNQSCSSSNVQCTPEIEKKYVHRVYDAIAPHFSSTRFAKWPKVASFLSSLPLGSLVLDAGCGNGKYLGFNPNCFFIGCDISAQLIKICDERGHEVLVADAVNLPYRTGFGDAAISIAVLHHLSTENRRRKAIEELIRVVKKGGLVLITVWAVEQEDKSLLTKWMPLSEKYVDEWVGPGSPRVRSPSSLALESIPEMNENHSGVSLKDSKENFTGSKPENKPLPSRSGNDFMNCNDENLLKIQQEYLAVTFQLLLVPLMLVSGMDDAVVVDRFYDKSNWCVVLEKTV